MSGALRGAWRRLGIEPTTDQGAIRRAYADALRAMDVDADVAGFAALRDARDTVLAWARQQPKDAAREAPEPESPAAPADEPAFVPGTWPHAAPRLDLPGSAEGAGVVAGEDHGHDALVPAPVFVPAQGPADAQFVMAQPTLGPAQLPAGELPVEAAAVAAARRDAPRADHALHALLLDGPGTEFGLAEAERARAAALIDELVAQADAGGVDLWARTEEWLAETLARAWPRSAPLLDGVARTFGWTDRPATTGDSPAVAFLIPRLNESPLLRTARPAEDALFTLLIPDEGSDEPLDEAGEAAAMQALGAVLDEARDARIERSAEIEGWLADLLVQSWPRSAPLLEPAAQAFNWESEHGHLNERPQIAYLNARLRGLRFVQKVQDKGHPLHRAWQELTRQGKRKSLFAPKAKVRQLIDGVRSNFPELEQHFNPMLVAAWEGRRLSGKGANFGWMAILLIGLIRMVIAIADYGNDHPVSAPRLPYETSVPAAPGQAPDPPFDPARDPVLADTVHRLFGADLSYADLARRNPNLAETLQANRRMTADAEQLARKAQTVLNMRFFLAHLNAKSPRLDDLARWRLDQMAAARADGPDTCLSVAGGGDLPPGRTLPEAALARQQKLARAMLAAGELDASRPQGTSRSYAIPGAMVDRVIALSQLSEARVRAAFHNQGSAADQCAVRIALIKAALAWQGTDRVAILQGT
ncbi:hypothetical protein [Novosphingobium pokkalii]|uniref:J domain-containing protein n=1 Tax=Novosphingobium pokkalii TaxID=1770194 RepID=A0ABV7V9D2_9SPHN|nr:hypothetical protein [Novosphingobium pokkalii]GHD01851.1 hypothetical protein GCM10019060_36620 [Novosphingobium pokkalii]